MWFFLTELQAVNFTNRPLERTGDMASGFSAERIDTKLRCAKHRTYMALRKPTVDCQPCRDMYSDAEKNRLAQKP
jgi:hypothetical protein